MTRLGFLISLGLLFASIPSGLAGPACARKHFQAADCVQRCKSRWGWTGALMNTNPWGSVVTKVESNTDIDAVIAEACGSTVASSAPAPVSTSSEFTRAISTASQTESVTVTGSNYLYPLYNECSFFLIYPYFRDPVFRTCLSFCSRFRRLFQAKAFIEQRRSVPARETTTSKPVVQTNTNTPARASPRTTSTSSTKPVSTSASTDNANTGSSDATSSSDINAYLAGHNTIRAQHGASPLTWSDSLAAKAQQWANGCKFKHSGGSLGPFGENLAAGTGSSYDIAAAIKSWTDEVSEYNSNSPQPSHFTQVVWKGTTQVGCAVQSCNGIFASSFGLAKYFVCEYSAQGNIIGQFAQNVQV